MSQKPPAKPTFIWSVLRGRARRRLGVGLVMMAVAIGYGAFAGIRFAARGADARAFDQPLVRVARVLTPLPGHLRTIQPENNRELYLVAVITDQQDVQFGLTLLILRMIVTLTVGGLGIVLVAGGSTEWEVRSELA